MGYIDRNMTQNMKRHVLLSFEFGPDVCHDYHSILQFSQIWNDAYCCFTVT
jgi:hypothetical protein